MKIKYINEILLPDFYMLDAFAYKIQNTVDNYHLEIVKLTEEEFIRKLKPLIEDFNKYVKSEDQRLSPEYQLLNFISDMDFQDSINPKPEEFLDLEDLIWILDKSNKDNCELRTIQNLLLKEGKLQYKCAMIDKTRNFNAFKNKFKNVSIFKEFLNYLKSNIGDIVERLDLLQKRNSSTVASGKEIPKKLYDISKNTYLVEIISPFKRYYLEEKVIPEFKFFEELMPFQRNISIYELRTILSGDLRMMMGNFMAYFEKNNESLKIEELSRIEKDNLPFPFRNYFWDKYVDFFYSEYTIDKDVCLIGQIEKKVYLDYINYIKSRQNIRQYNYFSIPTE